MNMAMQYLIITVLLLHVTRMCHSSVNQEDTNVQSLQTTTEYIEDNEPVTEIRDSDKATDNVLFIAKSPEKTSAEDGQLTTKSIPTEQKHDPNFEAGIILESFRSGPDDSFIMSHPVYSSELNELSVANVIDTSEAHDFVNVAPTHGFITLPEVLPDPDRHNSIKNSKSQEAKTSVTVPLEVYHGLLAPEGITTEAHIALTSEEDHGVPMTPTEDIFFRTPDSDSLQNEEQSDMPVDDSDVYEGDLPGVSIAFVFDTTYSMHNELWQVKKAAAQILDAFLAKKDVTIQNFIFVPFNDPNLEKIVVTKESKQLQRIIDEIVVDGGGDCPEMSLLGIQRAIELARPYSHFFVFTDADAKDGHRLETILALIQEKNCRVVFVLTGTCNDIIVDQSYVKIADASNGMVYNLEKHEVEKVLNYVKIDVNLKEVSLVSVKKPAPAPNTADQHTVVVDEAISKFKVAVAGINAAITVTDPKGVVEPPNVKRVLNLDNVKIVSVEKPDPGDWHVDIGSKSEYRLKATAESDVEFRHGFSTVLNVTIDETSLRPLHGSHCYLFIQVPEGTSIHNVSYVEIIGLDGVVKQKLPLTPHPTKPGLFLSAEFEPMSPDDLFNLGIFGYNKDGSSIRRVTSTAISSGVPNAPKVVMRPRSVAYINKPFTLLCNVTSLVPFTVKWFHNNILLVTSNDEYPQSCHVSYTIDKIVEKSEGNYTCQANNIAGVQWHSTTLIVTGSPPTVTTVLSRELTSIAGEVVELPCLVTSDVQPTVKWHQLTTRNFSSGSIHPVLNGNVHANHSLVISNVSAADEGWYLCSAENRWGRKESRVYLHVRHPLKVSVTPTNASFTKGESLKMVCRVTGLPEPTLQWRRDLIAISNLKESTYLEELPGELHLLLDNMEEKDAGVYSCIAMNSNEEVTANAELFYSQKPSIKARFNSVTVRAGAAAEVVCEATGIPAPLISWRRGLQVLHTDERFQVMNGSLKLLEVSSTDEGELTCVARNFLGESEDHIWLAVGTPPTFLQKPRDKKIHIGHNGTLMCSVMGTPPPEVTWSWMNGTLDASRALVVPAGGLRLINARLEDAGFYVCSATNAFGTISAPVNIIITGAHKPMLDKNLVMSSLPVVAGSNVTLPCGVSLGNPPGNVTWLWRAAVIDPSYGTVLPDGRLVLHHSTVQHAGEYTCSVANPIGNFSRTIMLDVLEEPHVTAVERLDEAVKVGEKVVLICPVSGNPRPKIAWHRKGVLVNISKNTYQDKEGNLVITKANEKKSGLYTCSATNELGSTSWQVALEVHVPPRPIGVPGKAEDNQDVVEGYTAVLNCKMEGVPSPSVAWFKDGAPLTVHVEDATSQVLRFVATLDDNGSYKCVVTNSAGSASKDFNLKVLVPPRIADAGDEPVHTSAGQNVNLTCGVSGVPMPTVLWRRNGIYLTQNTSDITLIGHTLVMMNVTEESAGAYTCDAENVAGIAQQTFYLHVSFGPRIIDEDGRSLNSTMTVAEGGELMIPCIAEGSPMPEIGWLKDGQLLHQYLTGVVVLSDDSLVFVQALADHSGNYTCRANNSEGVAERHYQLIVTTPLSLPPESDQYMSMEVTEGDSLKLTCPTSHSEYAIQWLKDGRLLAEALRERSDEPPMRISQDRRELLLAEAHPADSGNYSCVGTHPSGRVDAFFIVTVLMVPHFEEFNHVARRTVLVGGSVALNCSVSGNPTPQVSWKKDIYPIVPGRPPGVYVSRDQYHLMVPNARTYHTGTFTCIAANKMMSKEREFYVTVLEPPSILGESQEEVELVLGDRLVLECPTAGEPRPNISWYSEDCSGVRRDLNISDYVLVMDKASANETTLFYCEAKSTAGSATKIFNVTVLAPPAIDGDETLEVVKATEGENLSLRCTVKGLPRPEIAWLHNGLELDVDKVLYRSRRDTFASRAFHEDQNLEILTLYSVNNDDDGLYTMVASNRAGFTEKSFRVRVLAKPKPLNRTEVSVVSGRRAELTCPVEATSASITWLLGPLSLPNNESSAVIENKRLIVYNVSAGDERNYTCVATNLAGEIRVDVFLHVLEPPQFPSGNREDVLVLGSGQITYLKCDAVGAPMPSVAWLKGQQLLPNTEQSLMVTVQPGDELLQYICLASNSAGAAEKQFVVQVVEAPVELATNQTLSILLYRRFELYCHTSSKAHNITWYKDDVILTDLAEIYYSSDRSYLMTPNAAARHAGLYKCVDNNLAGQAAITFDVNLYVEATLSEWSTWSTCSVSGVSCITTRHRTCTYGLDHLDPKITVRRESCVGELTQHKECDREACPGAWTAWSDWTDCSVTCGIGEKWRMRECAGPGPCVGSSQEQQVCRLPLCRGRKWGRWEPWSTCSATCGKGLKRRVRRCRVEYSRTKPCADNVEVEECYLQPCSADLRINGQINGQTINSHVLANLSGSQLTARVDTTDELPWLSNFDDPDVEKLPQQDAVDPELSAHWYPYAPILLAPLAWNVAAEEESAANGFSLTKGRFLTQSAVTFAKGGEVLSLRAEGQGLDASGQLTVVIEVAGEAPYVEPYSSLRIKSLSQDFIQVADDTLIGLTEDSMMVNDEPVPFQINSTINYNPTLGTMPYFVEKFSVRESSSDVLGEEDFLWQGSATVSRRFNSNVCPPGTEHDDRHMLCQDVDECLTMPCPHAYQCTNTWGSYSCSCRVGYRADDGGRCLDVNECEEDSSMCQHSCVNSDGSFICSCSLGYTLASDGSTCIGNEESEEQVEIDKNYLNNRSSSDWKARRAVEWPTLFNDAVVCPAGYAAPDHQPSHCRDINECLLDPSVCGRGALCLNTEGSYQCLDTPCPKGYSEDSPTTCSMDCTVGQCRHGSRIAETLVYAVLPVQSDDFHPLEDLIQLTVSDDIAIKKHRAHLVEGHALRLRMDGDYAALYAPALLKMHTLYRVVAVVESLGLSDELLYATEFVVFVMLGK